jgi:hypothetical protein
VLGSADHWEGDSDQGFGEVAPTTIFNGGDPAGRLDDVVWREWGSAVATGVGMGYVLKPEGGYYDEPVRTELRADHLGTCAGRRGYARMLLRQADRPGGPMGDWGPWSDTSLCEPIP